MNRRKTCCLFIGLIFLLGIAFIISLISGQIDVSFASLFHLTTEQSSVLFYIRLPRTLLAGLVGAALAVSGAVLQGVFGNPLADPGMLGVSAGASLGAVIAVALGLTGVSLFYMPLFALAGALLTVSIIVVLAFREGRTSVMVLLLSGVAVSIFLSAFTSGILTFMNEYRLREFLFWMVGGLDYRRWEHVYLAVGPILLGIGVLCLMARHLNLLVLGDDEARSVGVSVAKLRLFFLFTAAFTTAAAVCVSGNIGFVGLVVPHIMRLLLGAEHRVLLPASALAGAFFLIFCDTLGRVIIPPIEIRVGIMTALLGAPYFLYLLRQTQKKGGLL
ncbi:MAG: iron ABC transporter permease [Sporomusaceae bacterium]|nr:iron ABC transporter permease [Sporomusaceae bacterium]